MKEIDEHIQRIHSKLQSLLKDYNILQKERNNLAQELEKAREKLTLQQQNIDHLKQQLSVMQLTAGESESYQMNTADKKEFEKRINNYLKEIDRCIAMLSE